MANSRKKAAATKTSTPAKKTAAKKNATAKIDVQEQVLDDKSTQLQAEEAAPVAETEEREEGGLSEEQLKALASRRKSASSASKAASKRAAPVVFTLEDVREVLKNRREEQEEERKEAARKAAVKRAEIKVEEPVQQRVLGAATLADILGFNPQQPSKPAPIADENEVPPKFRKYYKLLMELREHVLNGLDDHSRETLKRSPREDSGEVASFSSHMADDGTDAFDRDFALSLVANDQEALQEIDAAIKRIHDGSYGICEITGKPISPERLEAVPFTRYSLEGQAEYEKTTRRRLQRTNAYLDLSEDPGALSMDDDGDE